MSARSAAEVALGVAGIWLIVSRIPEFGANLALWPVGPDGVLHWVGVIHFSLVGVCGLALLLLRRRIASWLVAGPQSDLTGSIAGLQAAAFSIVGVVLLGHGLADVLGRLAMSVSYPGGITFRWFASGVAQIAVGLALFLGARGLITVWRSLRGARSRGADAEGDAA